MEGYRHLSIDDIKQSIVNGMIAAFGESVKADPDLYPNSNLSKIVSVMATVIHDVHLGLQHLEDSRSVLNATGQSLDDIAFGLGLKRKPASKASGTVQVQGEEGTLVPAGTLFSTASGQSFYSVDHVVIGQGGIASIDVLSELSGEVSVSQGQVSNIETPVNGLTAVYNNDGIFSGSGVETDSALRLRLVSSLEGAGTATASSIRAEVLNIDSISSCSVEENKTGSTVDGIPAYGIRVTVSPSVGVDVQQLGEALARQVPVGAPTAGDEEIFIVSPEGQESRYRFDYSNDVPISMTIDIVKEVWANEETVVQESIEAVRSYFQGVSSSSSLYQVSGEGLKPGDDVNSLGLYGALALVEGLKSAQVLMSRTGQGSPQQVSYISIDASEVPVLDENNFEVFVL